MLRRGQTIDWIHQTDHVAKKVLPGAGESCCEEEVQRRAVPNDSCSGGSMHCKDHKPFLYVYDYDAFSLSKILLPIALGLNIWG
jgi:hypothetical protein